MKKGVDFSTPKSLTFGGHYILGSIIYGTDESELILQPHFILGIKKHIVL
jgi:hypothetical protein